MTWRGLLSLGARGGDQTPGGISVVWREYAGWKVEGIVNFGTNVANFLLTLQSRRWYVVGTYVPPHDAPDVRRIEQVLEGALKGMEAIMLVDINGSLR